MEGAGVQSENTYVLFGPVDRKWVGMCSMRGEEAFTMFCEEVRELLRPDFG
jgi:hypothetical protein